MFVKICGIKSSDEIAILNKYIPDYAGIIFSKSRRYLEPQKAQGILCQLDGKIKKVGVFVNESTDYIVFVSSLCGLNAVQLHGEENEYYITDLKYKLEENKKIAGKVEIWKTLKVQSKVDLLEQLRYFSTITSAILFDSPGTGGNGSVFNWSEAKNLGNKYKIILAGGLNCGNLSEAANIVKPFMVDVSSGVETAGYKDDFKVKEFIRIAKSIAGGNYYE